MKKRYMLTLTKETVEAINADLRILRLPPGTMSGMVDEWLEKFAPTLHKMAEKKSKGEQLTFEEVIGDLFSEMGRAIKEE